MSKVKNVFSLILLLAVVLVYTSCGNDEEIISVENYTEKSVNGIYTYTASGANGCFELVFPIVINFPDDTSAEVNDLDELKDTIREWKEANTDAVARPSLEFPIEVINEDGELISVTSKEELKALKRECRPFHNNGCRPKACFKLVFPITLEFPDATTQEVANRFELKMAVRAWKLANMDSDERPGFVFPIEVITEDETTITVNSKEELIALKEACQDE